MRSITIRIPALAAMAALALQPQVVLAQAIGDTVVVGGPGGGVARDQCAYGWQLTGIDYVAGKDINNLTPVCSRIVNGHTTEGPVRLRHWGAPYDFNGRFGIAGSIACPPNTAAQGINVGVSRVNVVHDLTLRCRNPINHAYVGSARTTSGGGERGREGNVDCGGGAIAVGVVVHYGSMIDAVGLICQVIA